MLKKIEDKTPKLLSTKGFRIKMSKPFADKG